MGISLQNVRMHLDGLPLGDILKFFAISIKINCRLEASSKKTDLERILLPVVKQK